MIRQQLGIAVLSASGLHVPQSAPVQEPEPAKETARQLPADNDIWGYGSIGGPYPGGEPKPLPPSIVPTEWLVIEVADEAGAWAAVAPFLLGLDAPRPAASKEGAPSSGSGPAWKPRSSMDPRKSLCAFTRIDSERDEVRMARLTGAKYLFVNGEGFAGDPVRRGYRGVPVSLREGVNELFVLGASHDFELELWSPRTRMLIATWDVRWPNDFPFDDLHYALFNASLKPAEGVHVHYGHAVVDREGCQPRLTDWRDGGRIPPLGVMLGGSYANSLQGGPCDPSREGESIRIPICVWAEGDMDADRQMLRRTIGLSPTEPAQPTFPRALDLVSGGLFARLQADATLVYGTAGTPDESAALLARARFDQQLLWHRTGRVPLVLDDRTFLERRSQTKHVVLYGNEDTNAAWEVVVPDEPPISVRRGEARTWEDTVQGLDLSGWFVLRRRGHPTDGSLVAVIADTGLRGTQAGYLLRPLTEPVGEGDFAFFRLDETASRLEEIARGSP